MFRRLGNRLAGRKYCKKVTLQTKDIEWLITQITQEDMRDEDVRIDFNDGYGDFYSRKDPQGKIGRLREVMLGNFDFVRSLTMETYIGRESMKSYVEIRTDELTVSLEYTARIQAKNDVKVPAEKRSTRI